MTRLAASTASTSILELQAAWMLVVAFSVSLVYELWRATAKRGTSRHDSMRVFLTQDLVLYVLAGTVIALLLAGIEAAAWIGLVFSVLLVLVSVLYYNPRIMLERRPGLVDWAEDLVYTGLLFVAGALLSYEVLGWSLG